MSLFPRLGEAKTWKPWHELAHSGVKAGDSVTLQELINAHILLTIQRLGRMKDSANVLGVSVWELRTLRRKAGLAMRPTGRPWNKRKGNGTFAKKGATA